MKFNKQQISGENGDCFRTALSCLLDLEPLEVPNFFCNGAGGNQVWDQVDEWLASRDLSHCSFAVCGDLSDVFRMMATVNRSTVYLLAGAGAGGRNHQVIALADVIIHDPSSSSQGLIGPCDDGYYWISFLVPRSIHGGR